MSLLAWLGLAGLLVAGTVAVSMSDGPAAHSEVLDDGAAWLVSSAVGQAALIDGESAQVVTQVQVGRGDLSAAQSGANAYVANSSTGAVVRVDGATFTVSAPARYPDLGEQLAVFPGTQATYVVGKTAGAVAAVDPRTLRPRSGTQSLGARVRSGSALVDGAGRLWLVDGDSGALVRVDEQGKRRVPGAADPSRSALVLAGGQVVLVDTAAHVARPIDADGMPGAATCVDTRQGDETTTVTGSPAGDRVYVTSGSRGGLLISDLARRTCDGWVGLDAAGHDLGPAREVADKVFVPDYTTGQVDVIDLRTAQVIARPRVMPAGRPFELVPGGSFVFYNDPTSSVAGVVHLSGTAAQVTKYDPANPNAGLTGGGPGPGQGSAPPSAPPTTQPTATPPTSSRRPPAAGPARVLIVVSSARARVGEPVTMTVTASDGARFFAVRWRFGDGDENSGASVSHSWSAPGQYTVAAQVLLANGQQAVPTAQITVVGDLPSGQPTTNSGGSNNGGGGGNGGEPPTAALTVTPTTGPAPLEVNIDATRSRAGSAPISTYRFDFGDGTGDSGTALPDAVTHTYSKQGTYTVRITVADNASRSDSATATVTVGAAATKPTARLVVGRQQGAGVLAVVADASGSTPGSAAITGYAFDFTGSGSFQPSAGPTANYTFPAPGTYTVRVQVTDADNQTAQASYTYLADSKRLDITLNGSADAGTVTGPDEIQCPTVCGASFAVGQTVTLTARPDAGATFDGWSGDCAGTATSCTLTMDRARAVTATFTLKPVSQVTVSGESANPTQGTVACPVVVTFRATITVSAAMTVRYRWLRSDGAIDTNNEQVTFNGSGSQEVQTTWTLSPPAGETFWEQLEVTSPQDVLGNRSSFTLTCAP